MLTLVGYASAASLVVNVQPTLASISVDVPACGEQSQRPGTPVSWTPERDCTAEDEGPAMDRSPAPSVQQLPPATAQGPVDASSGEMTTEASKPGPPDIPAEPDAPAETPSSHVPAPTNTEEAPA